MRGVIHTYDSLITPPACAPVETEYAKKHLKSISGAEDTLISDWIEAARQHFEEQTTRQLIEATRERALDTFPAYRGRIELPYPPLRAVRSVSYLDASGVRQYFGAPSSPTVGESASARYDDADSGAVATGAVTTDGDTNLVLFVTGEAGAAAPAISDTFGNAWTLVGQQPSSTGYLWVFTSLDADGGAGHVFTASKTAAFMSIVAVEIVGTNLHLADLVFGVDNSTPFKTLELSTELNALALGAFAPGYQDNPFTITPANSFSAVQAVEGGGGWALGVASRAVTPGTYTANWTTSGDTADPDYANVLLLFTSTLYTVYAPAGPHAAPGWIEPIAGQCWPQTACQSGSVRIRYACGYGETPDDMPELVRAVLCSLVEHFEQRRAELPSWIEMALRNFKYTALVATVPQIAGGSWI